MEVLGAYEGCVGGACGVVDGVGVAAVGFKLSNKNSFCADLRRSSATLSAARERWACRSKNEHVAAEAAWAAGRAQIEQHVACVKRLSQVLANVLENKAHVLCKLQLASETNVLVVEQENQEDFRKLIEVLGSPDGKEALEQSKQALGLLGQLDLETVKSIQTSLFRVESLLSANISHAKRLCESLSSRSSCAHSLSQEYQIDSLLESLSACGNLSGNF